MIFFGLNFHYHANCLGYNISVWSLEFWSGNSFCGDPNHSLPLGTLNSKRFNPKNQWLNSNGLHVEFGKCIGLVVLQTVGSHSIRLNNL